MLRPKIVFILPLILIADYYSVFAIDHEPLETALKQAELSAANARYLIAEYGNYSRGHIWGQLQYELDNVDRKAKEIQHESADQNLASLHCQLNRLELETKFVEQIVRQNQNFSDNHASNGPLLEFAQQLAVKAKRVLASHHHLDQVVRNRIGRELAGIEWLQYELSHGPFNRSTNVQENILVNKKRALYRLIQPFNE